MAIEQQSERKKRFQRIASEYSDCSSAKRHGDLGSFGHGQMQKPFEDASFKLKLDEMSSIVDTGESGNIPICIAFSFQTAAFILFIELHEIFWPPIILKSPTPFSILCSASEAKKLSKSYSRRMFLTTRANFGCQLQSVRRASATTSAETRANHSISSCKLRFVQTQKAEENRIEGVE